MGVAYCVALLGEFAYSSLASSTRNDPGRTARCDLATICSPSRAVSINQHEYQCWAPASNKAGKGIRSENPVQIHGIAWLTNRGIVFCRFSFSFPCPIDSTRWSLLAVLVNASRRHPSAFPAESHFSLLGIVQTLSCPLPSLTFRFKDWSAVQRLCFRLNRRDPVL